jgi:hypothetical protein
MPSIACSELVQIWQVWICIQVAPSGRRRSTPASTNTGGWLHFWKFSYQITVYCPYLPKTLLMIIWPCVLSYLKRIRNLKPAEELWNPNKVNSLLQWFSAWIMSNLKCKFLRTSHICEVKSTGRRAWRTWDFLQVPPKGFLHRLEASLWETLTMVIQTYTG